VTLVLSPAQEKQAGIERAAYSCLRDARMLIGRRRPVFSSFALLGASEMGAEDRYDKIRGSLGD